MTEAQAGIGNNYSRPDFQILSERRLDVLQQCDPDVLKKFRDALIVVADKLLRDNLNTKMVSAFASSTSQDVRIYHSRDRYRKVPLQGLMRHHAWQVGSKITNDNPGWLPLVLGMRVMVTENAAMAAKSRERQSRNIKRYQI